VTPSESARIVAMLANAPDSRGSAAWTIETQEVFARLIEDLDYEPTMAAALTWLKTQPMRPAISDLRAAVRAELEAVGAIPADPDPDQAWGIVTRAFSSVGRYRPFPFDNPLVKRVVDRIGWETLCNSDNPEADRAHFLRMYAAELDRDRDARHATDGLTLPYDQARLARKSEPPHVGNGQVLRLPSPEERAAGASAVREINALLGHVVREVPRAEPEPAEELREPTAEELRAAADRRAVFRTQLEQVEPPR
jgi:hypothetical protein